MSELTSFTFRVTETNVEPIKTTIGKKISECFAKWTDVDVVIKKHTNKKTVEQNNRLWKMYEIIAETAWVDGKQFKNTTWHYHLKGMFLGFVEEELPDGTIKSEPRSTTTLSTTEMTEYQNKIEAWGAHNFNISFYYEG